MIHAITAPQRSWQRGWAYRNRRLIAASVLLIGVIVYFCRWRILAKLASICGFLLQADSPAVVRSLAGKGLRRFGQ
jgi:hypothetical protein